MRERVQRETPAEEADSQIAPPDIRGFLPCRWKFIASIKGVVITADLVLSLFLTKHYAATTQIPVDTKQASLLSHVSLLVNGVLSDTAGTDSQISLTKLGEPLRRVVEISKLENGTDFGPATESVQLARFEIVLVSFDQLYPCG